MKKLFVIFASVMLFACSSTPNTNYLLNQMPTGERSVILQVLDTGNPISNGIMLGMIKTSGGNGAKQLMSVLPNNDMHIGVYGRSAIITKAVTIYALEHTPSVGRNVSLYYLANDNADKVDLENTAKLKGVKLHYILQK